MKAIDEETKKVPDENIVRHFNIYLLLFLGKAMRDPEFVSLGGTYGQDFAFPQFVIDDQFADGILQISLQGTFQRTRAILYVVSFAGKELLGILFRLRWV